MAVISGKNGTVYLAGNEETPVTDWFVETFANLDQYAANDTAGWTKRKAGVKDCTGGFNINDLPSVNEGDEVTFIGYTDQDIYTIPIIIERIRVTVDMNTGAIVNWAVTFQGNGAVAKTTGSAP